MAEKAEKHKKVWGKEEWLANTEKYCGKILTLKPGFSCSYHYHKNKDETFYVLSGLVYLNVEGQDIIMRKGESLRIQPGQKHKFASLKGTSKIIEISTHHEEDDSYREIESGKIDLEELKTKLKAKGLIE
jgi:mannose-6-phosphate isomerase-like protein (cupin superfamily)